MGDDNRTRLGESADGAAGTRQQGSPLARLREERGVVFVEFLIAFLPVQVFFLCLIQLAILFSVRLVVDHAAINAARAAAVVIGDAPRPEYEGDARAHVLTPEGGRMRSIRRAALLSMAPLIMMGTIQSVRVDLPPAEEFGGPAQEGEIRMVPMGDDSVAKVRVRVEVEAACRIGFASRIVCPSWRDFLRIGPLAQLIAPTRTVRSEAIFPYQGAKYEY
jgi:hypothetical protein